MTGAGSATVAWAEETTFLDGVGEDPTWREPGHNVEVGSASLENALQRARRPSDPRPTGSREGNKEGALSVSFDLTDDEFFDLVFADGGTALADSAMRAPTAVWYISADVLDGTEERFLAGAAVESMSIQYQQGEMASVELTIIYADEPDDLTAPSAIEQTAKEDIVAWHECDWKIDGASLEKLQSLSLEVSGMARFRRGQSRTAEDAVVGAYEPSLNAQAILQDDTQRSLAYGSSTAAEPLDSIDATDTALELGDVADLNVLDVQPNSYDWADLVAPDTDITDPTDYHVRTVEVDV